MASDAIEVEGIVKDVLWWGKYLIHIEDMDIQVEAYAAGKMKKFNIKIIPGDLVQVELNPYEPTKGRITYRSTNKWGKKRRAPSASSSNVATWDAPKPKDTPKTA